MIEYMILNNTGNILRDVLDTLNKFNKKDIELLIQDYYKGNQIIFLYKEDYEIIPKLKIKKKSKNTKKDIDYSSTNCYTQWCNTNITIL